MKNCWAETGPFRQLNRICCLYRYETELQSFRSHDMLAQVKLTEVMTITQWVLFGRFVPLPLVYKTCSRLHSHPDSYCRCAPSPNRMLSTLVSPFVFYECAKWVAGLLWPIRDDIQIWNSSKNWRRSHTPLTPHHSPPTTTLTTRWLRLWWTWCRVGQKWHRQLGRP